MINIIPEEPVLRDMYWNKSMSLAEIGDVYGRKTGIVYYWMQKYNIPTRNPTNGLRIKSTKIHSKTIPDSLIEFVEGNLLGDGRLIKATPTSNAYYVHGDKHKSYVEWICSIFESNNIKCTMNQVRENYWFMFTEVNTNLTKLYNKWHNEHQQFEIPSDFKITPIKFRQWYIGDGSRRVGDKRNDCTISKPIRWLDSDKLRIQSLIKEIGIDCTWHKNGDVKLNTLSIRRSSIQKFFDYIGECPVECYAYKWAQKEV